MSYFFGVHAADTNAAKPYGQRITVVKFMLMTMMSVSMAHYIQVLTIIFYTV